MAGEMRPRRLFYGWVGVACAWVANFVTVSMNPLIFAFFLDPMAADLGMRRSTLVWGSGSGSTAVSQSLMIPDYFGRTHQGAIRGGDHSDAGRGQRAGRAAGRLPAQCWDELHGLFRGVFVAVVLASGSFIFQKSSARLRAHARTVAER